MLKKSVKLHPLVIVSACDHHTRVATGGSHLSKDAPAIGLLFGSTNNQKNEEGNDEITVQIVDATDAVYTFDSLSNNIELNMTQLKKKRDLWQEVYPSQPLLGWYAVGAEVNAVHLSIHEEISSLVVDPSSALMLLINPVIDKESNHLPLLLFELDAIGAQQAKVFIDIPFKLESTPIESAVMDTVIKANPPEGVSSVEVQNESLVVSLRALLSRVDIILKEVTRMESGEIPVNYDILRKAAKISNLLSNCDSVIEPKEGSDTKHVTESIALSMLGIVASNLRQLHALQGSYQEAYSERGRSGGLH